MLLPITPNMDTPYADVDVAIFEIADTLLFQTSVFARRYPQASLKIDLPFLSPYFYFQILEIYLMRMILPSFLVRV